VNRTLPTIEALHNPLTAQQAETLNQERALLEDLRVTLAQLDAAPDDQRRLAQALRQLEELFLLVIVGEFNAGKSAFINALLGDQLLAEGVTPTTDRIHLLKYGPQAGQTMRDDDILIVTRPVDWLREINIVDTPGTNAVIQRHQQITEDFVPRSDLVLFVTSADRPFAESERAFLERVREWGKKIVIVINKIDIFEDTDKIQQVTQFVEDNAQLLLGTRPQIFPVSARLAQRAKSVLGVEQSALWQASQFGPLEEFILNTLDERQRLRLKLESPLGIAARLQEQYLSSTRARIELLDADFKTIDRIEEQLGGYAEDMRHNFKFKLSQVDNVLHRLSARGIEFFDDTLRLGRVFDLINTSRVRAEFEEKVVAASAQEVEDHVRETIDWLVDQDYRQWQRVIEYVNRQAEPHQDKLIGQVGSQFDHTRHEKLAAAQRAAREIVNSYNKAEEARQLADSVRTAIAQTALVEVGAIGLGAVLVAILHGVAADATGVLAAGTVAVLGLFILPKRRSQAKEKFRAKIEDLRGRLSGILTDQFEHELSLSVQRIREAIAPYTVFVRKEYEKLSGLQDQLMHAAADMQSLRIRIKDL
jgi:small GTP-binding protein